MKAKTPTAAETTAGASSLAGDAIVASFADMVKAIGAEPADQETAQAVAKVGGLFDAYGIVFRCADATIINRFSPPVVTVTRTVNRPVERRGIALEGVDASRMVGTFPRRVDTARADVLMRLLLGKRLTPKDAHRESSTMRVAAHVHTIIHDWGWPVQAPLEAVGCRDGRITSVCRYRLSDECREAALAAGGREWCDRVIAARSKRRQGARLAQSKARRINAKRSQRKGVRNGG